MNKISVMLVDDSSVMRTFLNTELKKDPEIEVISFASNGKVAIPRFRHYKPQVVILDYEMPELNGIETLKVIQKDFPEISVIMFSAYTVQGAQVTLQALELGAKDFVRKPDIKSNAREYIKENLVPKIKALALKSRNPASSVIPSDSSLKPSIPRVSTRALSLPGSFELAAIGISTGGPVALKQLLKQIPGNIDGSIVITQHMPPVFTTQLAEMLNQNSELTVLEGAEGMELEKGCAYIAPGGGHMLIHQVGNKRQLKIDNSPHYLHCRPSVNLMFHSLLKLNPSKTMAILMTGMGSDGFEAIQELHKENSYLVAQSAETCVVYGMPAPPTEAKIIDESLNIEQIAQRIKELLGTR